jgi:polysaccharide biosynthesis transport protein
VPLYPTSPKRKQIVIVAGGTGLLLGLALAVLFELMAPGILRGRDIPRVLASAHLGSMPQIVTQGDAQAQQKAIRLVVAEPQGLYADCIRSTRRELDLKRPGDGPRVIMVTSSMPGEGAITLASNLAHHYGLSNGSTLLIDGDFRLQTLTKQLAQGRQTGLLDQLAQGADISKSILRDGVSGLHFLPASGPAPTHVAVSEAVSSQVMAEAIQSLKSTFNTIILLAPPVLPVIDARIFADYADQVVFVMAWQRTPRELAKRAIGSFGSNAEKIAGVVLNDVPEETLTETGVWSNILKRPSPVGSELYRGRQAA